MLLSSRMLSPWYEISGATLEVSSCELFYFPSTFGNSIFESVGSLVLTSIIRINCI